MRLLIATRILEAIREMTREELEEGFKSWTELRNKWAALGKVVGTFYSPGSGLPAQNGGEWCIFKIYEVPDMDTVEAMWMAYFRSEIKKGLECKFIVGKPDDLEKEWLEKQKG